jgi:predicted transposase YdaD
MSKKYDATPKGLVEMGPADWAAFLGLPADAVEVVDADVSTVTAAADKVLRVHTAAGALIQHIDFQAGPDASVPQRTHGYNALLEERHGIPVASVVFLLRPEANLRTITGLYKRCLPGKRNPYLRFRYRVIRVWRVPVDTFLKGGVSLTPFAPIGAVTAGELPGVISRMQRRLDQEPDQTLVGELWTATRVLLGLRYAPAFIETLLRGIRAMRESTTYQAILEEGRVEEARRILLHQGELLFKRPATAAERAALDSITDVAELERLTVRLLQVPGWSELLGLPATPRRTRRKKS